MKVIDYQKIDLTDEEYTYYQNIIKQVDPDEFRNIFKTNDNGVIYSIVPAKPVSWIVIFFLQQIMINQRLRENDKRLETIEKKIGL